MVRPVRAWLDSQGQLHATRQDACKADFRRLLLERFDPILQGALDTVPLDALVDAMFELDMMIGLATKEDTRADLSVAA